MFELELKKGITALGDKAYDLSLTADKVVERPTAKDPFRKITIYAPDLELLEHLYRIGATYVKVKTKIAEPVKTEVKTNKKGIKHGNNNRDISSR